MKKKIKQLHRCLNPPLFFYILYTWMHIQVNVKLWYLQWDYVQKENVDYKLDYVQYSSGLSVTVLWIASSLHSHQHFLRFYNLKIKTVISYKKSKKTVYLLKWYKTINCAFEIVKILEVFDFCLNISLKFTSLYSEKKKVFK